ncbi:alpha/beta fold hydrolase [Defluviimonas aestuarii]|uniref:alpha/beta fold hydrolase n=1 Tax=Albidovulum aestuarii TaxID=1130726 RepID=UPI00249C1876|nr:alpha/beta fold hydrolase [Defluviimonas aestuarii]MDI3337372.1 alpha/beta fold hydrolase [Defluviimonas aestuarii]
MRIVANGVHLEVEEHGDPDAPALILIRGLGSQIVHWAPELITGLVAAGYRLVTFDNRDVGLSARCPVPGAEGDADAILAYLHAGQVPKPAYVLSDMARDVTGLMDALGIDRAHVFGISMGGAIVQLLACDYADRLLSATIVMSSARLRGLDLGERLLSRPAGRADYIEAALAGDREWGSPGFPATESYLRAQAERAYDRGAEAEGVNRQLMAILNTPDRRDALQKVALPCLVIHGEEDTLIPPEEGREIASLIPGAELEVIDGMGHVITPALAPVIVELVERFIAGRSA